MEGLTNAFIPNFETGTLILVGCRLADLLDPRAFETGTLCRFQIASHGLKA